MTPETPSRPPDAAPPDGLGPLLSSIVDAVPATALAVLDTDLRVRCANRAFRDLFGPHGSASQESGASDAPSATLVRHGGLWSVPGLRAQAERALQSESNAPEPGRAALHDLPGRGRRLLVLSVSRLILSEAAPPLALLAVDDRTESEAAKARDGRIARALQRPLSLEVAENAFADLSVAMLYEAALDTASAGGDFFDAFALPGGRVALVVGDVSGKGLPAAARMSQVKDGLRTFLGLFPQNAGLALAGLNDWVCDTRDLDDEPGRPSFVALTLAVIEPYSGRVEVVSAGCEPPLVLGAAGGSHVLMAPGMPLGVECRETYQPALTTLAHGDTLILVTDGITEARRAAEPGETRRTNRLGYDGMVTLARRAAQSAPPSLRALGKQVLDDARAFAGGALSDDACLLLARRR